ncbi:MAG: hypothetical protein K5905_14785 [Roseibium sp.]|uniref:hypothetical protein n=1 Tax=Roseibium sp. TaxID=1936156 RepID=UPI00261E0C99|nr:hypothetical protein [Roseibium sp.]MCV0426726.1 hypothetical protein [Roseibium sp.]
MRLMMTFKIPTLTGNEAGTQHRIGAAIEKLVADTGADASYFFMKDGMRAGVLFFEEDDQANLPRYNEPLMESLGAQIDIVPVLNLDDLKRGLEGH